MPIGLPDTPATIPGGAAQSFVISLAPSAAFAVTDIRFDFACSNTPTAPALPGVSTLLLASTSVPGPDIVALAATLNNDGIVALTGPGFGGGAFAVATVNVGAAAEITVTADTGAATVPVQLFLCQTDPVTGQCTTPLSQAGGPIAAQINAGQTPTFGIFVQGLGAVSFLPGVNRVFVRFATAGGAMVGATSVAVRTP